MSTKLQQLECLRDSLEKQALLGSLARQVVSKGLGVASKHLPKAYNWLRPAARQAASVAPKLPAKTKSLARNVMGVAPGESVRLRDVGRGVYSPRYPGLDRAQLTGQSGFIKPWKDKGLVKSHIPVGWNPRTVGARPWDRTRQAAANALRLSNKAIPIGAAGAAGTGVAQRSLYGIPREAGHTLSTFAGLDSYDRERLINSVSGSNALSLIPSGLTSSGPLATSLRREIAGSAWPSIQRGAADRLDYRPLTSAAVDSFRMLSPLGAASTAMLRSVPDHYPTVAREDQRKFWGNLISSSLGDPENVEHSSFLKQLTKQVPDDLRNKLISGLQRRAGISDGITTNDFGAAARRGLEGARKELAESGVSSSEIPSVGRAVIDALYGGPSKDIEREKEILRQTHWPVQALIHPRRQGPPPTTKARQLSEELGRLHPSYLHKSYDGGPEHRIPEWTRSRWPKARRTFSGSPEESDALKLQAQKRQGRYYSPTQQIVKQYQDKFTPRRFAEFREKQKRLEEGTDAGTRLDKHFKQYEADERKDQISRGRAAVESNLKAIFNQWRRDPRTSSLNTPVLFREELQKRLKALQLLEV